jgi:hypothetical protein
MDAKEAVREAREIAVLINDGRIALIGERYGEAKRQAAYGWIPHNSSFGLSDKARATLGVFASLDRF